MRFAVNFKRKEILLVNRDSFEFCSEEDIAFYCLYQTINKKFVTAEITFQIGNCRWYNFTKELQEQLAQRLKYIAGHPVHSF